MKRILRGALYVLMITAFLTTALSFSGYAEDESRELMDFCYDMLETELSRTDMICMNVSENENILQDFRLSYDNKHDLRMVLSEWIVEKDQIQDEYTFTHEDAYNRCTLTLSELVGLSYYLNRISMDAPVNTQLLEKAKSENGTMAMRSLTGLYIVGEVDYGCIIELCPFMMVNTDRSIVDDKMYICVRLFESDSKIIELLVNDQSIVNDIVKRIEPLTDSVSESDALVIRHWREKNEL